MIIKELKEKLVDLPDDMKIHITCEGQVFPLTEGMLKIGHAYAYENPDEHPTEFYIDTYV